MVLILLLALGLIGVVLALLARAAFLPRMRAGETIGQIEAYGYAGEAAAEPPPTTAALPQLASRVGGLLAGRRGEKGLEDLRTTLQSAGFYGVSPASFLGYRALAAAAFAALLLWLSSTGHASLIVVLIAAAYGPILGWTLPMFVVKARARRRLERIELELPELIDLLVVTLEAGMAFSAALQRSASRLSGPLGDELRLALREQSLGLSTHRALQNLVQRCDAPGVRSFVRSVVQGDSLGASIAKVVRELAGDLRKRRRQLVEEKAHKAPIKMLFPLAFLILPPMFVVLLYPGLTNIITALGGG